MAQWFGCSRGWMQSPQKTPRKAEDWPKGHYQRISGWITTYGTTYRHGPVVTGMSGGPVLDAKTLKPIGITITRNSPADLNNDREPDESADFIALSDVWEAISNPAIV